MDIFALNSLLIVSLSVFRLSDARARTRTLPHRRSFGNLNVTQTIRTDLYAKMEMLAWICDIYR